MSVGAPSAPAPNLSRRQILLLITGLLLAQLVASIEGTVVSTAAPTIVADLGGLHVIGANRHDSRRIDDQLRGRAGRQGDPGSSQFFVSGEDRLIASMADAGERLTADQAQRRAEGRNLDTRIFLRKYELVIEGQRRSMRAFPVLKTARPGTDLRRNLRAALDSLDAAFASAS